MKQAALLLLRFYKLAISPYVGSCCRFTPSCSDYAREAIEVHGVVRGIVLGMGRLLRCGPWSRGGIDPVPPA